jgi:hypothetical protein
MAMTEGLVGRSQVLSHPAAEIEPTDIEQPMFERDDSVVVDSTSRK